MNKFFLHVDRNCSCARITRQKGYFIVNVFRPLIFMSMLSIKGVNNGHRLQNVTCKQGLNDTTSVL